MNNKMVNSESLSAEVVRLRKRVAELEASKAALKRAEEALIESEELHRITLSNISDAVFITVDTGEFTYICPNVDVIFGYSYEEVHEFRFISALLGEALFDHVELENVGEIKNIERHIADKYEKTHTLLVNVKRVSIQNGTVLYTCRDITERKIIDEELQAYRRQLEEMVKARTAELTAVNDKLRKEIDEHKRTEEALRASEEELRFLSSNQFKAQENERRRIALELHDEMGQSLTLLKLQLRSTEKKLPDSLKELTNYTQKALHQTEQMIESVRRISRDLSPSILEDLGLDAAIQWLINDAASHFNFNVSADLKDIDSLIPPDAHIILFRIFQEAFTNIGKHSNATHVAVVIEVFENSISFSVQDNGRGFDKERFRSRDAGTGGMGLAAMQERARMLGGAITIESEKAKGTKIALTVPIAGWMSGHEV